MTRQRLFWKLFLSFWVALLLFTVGVLIAASVYLDGTRESKDIDPRSRAEAALNAAQTAAQKGMPAFKAWLRDVDHAELVPLMALDTKGQDLLGRDVSARAQARLAYMIQAQRNNSNTDFRPPILQVEQKEIWLVADFHGVTLSRLISRPRVVTAQLVLATLIGAIVCLLLAGYLTAPLKRLREATLAYGSGDFSHRVTPSMGKRKDEIVDLARSMDTMAERINALIESQRGLLRDVSHELRSPLARVQVAVGLARQRAGGLAEAELNRIDSEMEKLNELIGRIIDFSRLDAGLQTLHIEPVRLEQITAEVVTDARLEAERKSCVIECQLPSAAAIEGDPALLASAIENILRNAVRHAPKGSRINLKLTEHQTEGHWQLRISDSGPGIPEHLLANVFEPFVRVEDHRNPQSGGIGLGLAIARKAIDAHQGRIELHNIETGGLQVTLYLPTNSAVEKASS